MVRVSSWIYTHVTTSTSKACAEKREDFLRFGTEIIRLGYELELAGLASGATESTGV